MAESKRKYSSLCRKNFSLAEEAFVGQGGNTVNLYACRWKKIKIILRDNPDTLQGAITIATKEQNSRVSIVLFTHLIHGG